MKRLAHVVSRQSGSAYPLVDLALILRRNGWQIQCFAYQHSENIFTKADLSPLLISSFEDYQGKSHAPPDLLLTGTSIEAPDDQKFWHFAKQSKIKSIAWVDQPINLKERFHGAEESLPGLILANDVETCKALKSMGLAATVKFIGSPHLRTLQKSLKRTVDKFSVYFATEPTTLDDSSILEREISEYRRVNGFDDLDSYLMASQLVKQVRGKTGEPWRLYVKLHPRDSENRFGGSLKHYYKNSSQIEYTDLNRDQIFERAHIVVGMRSMILFEAAQLGVPVISFQPNRKTSSLVTDNRKNILTLTTGRFDIEAVLDFLQSAHEMTLQEFKEDELILYIS